MAANICNKTLNSANFWSLEYQICSHKDRIQNYRLSHHQLSRTETIFCNILSKLSHENIKFKR